MNKQQRDLAQTIQRALKQGGLMRPVKPRPMPDVVDSMQKINAMLEKISSSLGLPAPRFVMGVPQ